MSRPRKADPEPVQQLSGVPSKPRDAGLYWVQDGVLYIDLHPGQAEAHMAEERIILVLAGTQSGKTTYGPIWLYREIQRKGPGDYAVIAPSFALMEVKAIPEFKRFFEETLRLGKYYQSPIRKFVFSREGQLKTFGEEGPTTVYFGYAENPDSLESATYKAAWLDEAGQKAFRLESWDAIQRRLSIHRGRVLITTTPYDFGWLKRRIYDKWVDGDKDIRVVRFESTMNPAFPLEEFIKKEKELPKWKFDMMYRAVWARPAGVIYDCFDDELHLIHPFPIPEHWPRIMGIDFGQANTAAAFLAYDRERDRLVLYRTYNAGSKSVEGHVRSLLSREGEVPFAVGGSPSEEEWRARFSAAGLRVARPSVSGVEEGIDYVYQAFASGRLVVMSHLERIVSDLKSYSRVLDADGEPTEKIEDKSTWHRLDALRYAVSEFMHRNPFAPRRVVVPRFSPKDE